MSGALRVSESALEFRVVEPRVSSLRYRVFGFASPRAVVVKAEKKKPVDRGIEGKRFGIQKKICQCSSPMGICELARIVGEMAHCADRGVRVTGTGAVPT